VALMTLTAGTAATVEALCELLVPGSSRVGPAVYIDAALAEHERTPEFAVVVVGSGAGGGVVAGELATRGRDVLLLEVGPHLTAADFVRWEAKATHDLFWPLLASTHVQGSCRMGDDPTRSAVDRNGESHDAKRLFVGDGSLVPRTLSVNPSLTIMPLATRLAGHLDADPKGYLGSRAAA
jgi:choline dehydrogenase-like flavoprotein